MIYAQGLLRVALMTNIYWLCALSAIPYVYAVVCCYNFTLGVPKKLSFQDWLVIGVVSLVVAANNLYNNIFLILPCSMVLAAILFYLIFKEKNRIFFYKVLFIFAISILVDFILSMCLFFFINNAERLNSMNFMKFCYSIMSSYALFFTYRTKLVLRIYSRFHRFVIDNLQWLYYFAFILLVIGYNYLIYSMNFRNNLMSMLLIVFIILLGLRYINQIYNYKILELKNRFLEDNLDLFKNTLHDYSVLKHNIINDFLFIQTLCDKEGQKLITLKMEKYSKNTETIDKIIDVPPGFQGLIYLKIIRAKQYGIDVALHISGHFDYKTLDFKLYIDLCEVIGIILDNAIEAARETINKIIFLSINKSDRDIQIEIINSFKNDIDLDRIGNKNYSTKVEGNGLGLSYIQKLNRNITIEKEIINDLFKTTIVVKENKTL